ncbi:DNA/RNA non-specific endonuclease [Xanthobacter sp. V4C-4]|uniref:DNA/RNA non-specific endonuclease n=1 Tax=Xanthobacter cornucopiae TaxID=3119924 RepID=UPI003728AEC3
MASVEERLEHLRSRLTPAVREAIEKSVANGTLPAPLAPVAEAPELWRLGLPAAVPETFRAQARRGGENLFAIPRMVAGLEAIVQRVGRPPLLVRNDGVVLEDLPDFPTGTDDLIRGVEGRIPSVGRVEFLNHALSWAGTGWVVEDAAGHPLVVTNRHVAALVAKRKADGSAIFMRSPYGQPYGAAIDFLAEVDRTADSSRTARVAGIAYLADDASADIALLRLDTPGFTLPAPLVLDETAVALEELVAVIGYPAFDSRNNVDDQARYFRDLYEVKRFAPGFVTQVPGDGAAFSHDCTTLGGNSGSPLVRLATGKVVGLHFQGEYGKANSAIGAATLLALLRGQRPVAVRLALERQERADLHHAAEHFAGRNGFDTAFLGEGAPPTPWPGLPDRVAADLAAPNDDPPEPNELRYTHFGVKYSAGLKLPVLTAVNIDGARAVRIKRGADQWATDGRLPRDIQLGAANFADPAIDRGHMVRREDPNWGAADEAQQANDDTFHYVNAAAQHATLNQGKLLWQGLETYVLDSARTYGLKASVFTGPVLRGPEEDDETIIDGAVVPLEFWKLVVTLDADGTGLHATAYLLSQGELIRKLLDKRSRREGLEGFTLGAYRTFQLAVGDLAAATGYDLSAYVASDPLRRRAAGREALDRGEPVFLPLETPGDLRL